MPWGMDINQPKKRRRRKSKNKAMAVPAGNSSMSIRKIDNGYIVSESGTRRNGEFYSRETFSPTKPKVTVKT